MITFIYVMLLANHCAASSTTSKDFNVSYFRDGDKFDDEDFKNSIHIGDVKKAKANIDLEMSDVKHEDINVSYSLNLDRLENQIFDDSIRIKDVKEDNTDVEMPVVEHEDIKVSYDFNPEKLENEIFEDSIRIKDVKEDNTDVEMPAVEHEDIKVSYEFNPEKLENEIFEDSIQVEDAKNFAAKTLNRLTKMQNLSKTMKAWQTTSDTITFYEDEQCVVCFKSYTEEGVKAVRFGCYKKNATGHHLCEYCRDNTYINKNVVEYENIKVGECLTCRAFVPIDEKNNYFFPELQNVADLLKEKMHRAKHPEPVIFDEALSLALIRIQDNIELATTTDDDDLRDYLWEATMNIMATLDDMYIESFIEEADRQANRELRRAARGAKELKQNQFFF